MALSTYYSELQRQMEYERRRMEREVEEERRHMMRVYETSMPFPPVTVAPSKPKSNKKLLLCK